MSRQRVRELDGMAEKEGRPIARHADFPAAVTRPPTGALFDRAEIVAFGAAWERPRGPAAERGAPVHIGLPAAVTAGWLGVRPWAELTSPATPKHGT